jgi:hypothetical protein
MLEETVMTSQVRKEGLPPLFLEHLESERKERLRASGMDYFHESG